ncbi:hypothetical protein EIP86_010932 [Pleurotus ostreatoroseus]|nr:hypothetical protein EIP86_010932 [Pleurotus ostreatoroseus]
MIPSTISCNHMLSFPSPSVTQASLLASFKQERSLARYAARVAECSKASRILPRLYLSSYRVAASEEELDELGITHVVSVLEYPPDYSSEDKYKTLRIRIEDTLQANILEHLETTTAFIRDALAENATNKVLVRTLTPSIPVCVLIMRRQVHCMMGVSRSATVVCAYLVATTPMIASEALAFVRERRSIVRPNSAFQQQLEAYALQFYGKDAKARRTTRLGIADGVADTLRRLRGLRSVHLRNASGPSPPSAKVAVSASASSTVTTSESAGAATALAVETMTTTTAVAEAETSR